jgi:hypothetical protein
MVLGKSSNFGQCEEWQIWPQCGEHAYDLTGVRSLLVKQLPDMEEKRPVDNH